MPRGGKRDGAGRKPVFAVRKAIPVYMEEQDLHSLRAFIDFYKDLQGARVSTSNILYELARIWLSKLRADHEEQYLAWAKENMAIIQSCYPLEAKRLKRLQKKRKDGEKTWTPTGNGNSSNGD